MNKIESLSWSSMLALVLALALVGCGGEDTPHGANGPDAASNGPDAASNGPGEPASQVIGPEGGEVAGVGVRLLVPAGAVSVETELTLTVLSGDDADGAVRAVEVGPEGTVFAGPVTLEMRALPELEADEAYQLSLSVAGEWVPLPEAYEVSGAGTAGARLRHLSRYGVLKRKRENRAVDPCECSEARRAASDACCESVDARLGGATDCGRVCLLDPVAGPQDFGHEYSQMWGILNCWYEGIAADYFRETAHGRCARKCCERPNGNVVGWSATWARYDGENVVCRVPLDAGPDAFLRCLDACPEPEREGAPQCACANAAEASCGGVCVDLQSDRGNCGRCGVACQGEEVCSAGECACANAAETSCGGVCVDLQSDRGNCGRCGVACQGEKVCSAGECACANAAETSCGGVCVDLQSDLANCGRCGVACDAGEACTEGACALPPGYVRIEPGMFTMGSPAGELGRGANEVQHQVTITRAFLMKTTEVTQAEWQAVMGYNPSSNAACGATCPVENVSWNEAVDYINRLSDAAGLARCYDANRAFAGLGCLGYRLPTEAEWEYSARAGTQTAYHTGANTQTNCNNDPNLNLAGWYCGNAANTRHPVGLKQVNAWGLYDMHGNVWEWVQDWSAAYPAGAAVDPVGPAAGDFRVVRGGAWSLSAQDARAANRYGDVPEFQSINIGFRPARSL